MMNGLEGRAAIVTGAGRGIGEAIAKRLLAEGCRVLAVDIREDGLGALPAGERLRTMVADVTAEGAPAAIIAHCVAEFGAVEVLVNNAGLGDAPPLHDTADTILDKYLSVNLRSVIRLSRDALPELRKSRGTIVNIASSVGLAGYPRASAYSAAKGGVIALTRNMAGEYGSAGIRVNAVAPSIIITPMTEGRLKSRRFQALVVGTMPLGDVGRPEDVAAAVAFLASSEARMISGQTLAIDGGQTTSVFISEDILACWEDAAG